MHPPASPEHSGKATDPWAQASLAAPIPTSGPVPVDPGQRRPASRVAASSRLLRTPSLSNTAVAGAPCHTGAMSEPVLPMATTDALPQGLQQGVVNRCAVLTSRHHPTPGEARDALAEWADRCNYNAVVGV